MSHTSYTSTADSFSLLGKRYNVDRVLSNANAGPTISVKCDELDLTKDHTTDHTNRGRNLDPQSPVVFYQWEGKYIVVYGFDKVYAMASLAEKNNGADKLQFKGKLLTKHSIKKCLVDNNPDLTKRIINEQIQPEYQNRYDGQSRDDRPRRNFGNSDRPNRDRNQRWS